MAYYIDDHKITLQNLMTRLCETDLIPSRQALVEDIERRFETLRNNSILTLADLRKALKTPKGMAALSDATQIHVEYLTLLRREIESYYPKTIQLREFDWLDLDLLSAMEKIGYSNAVSLFEAGEDPLKRQEIIRIPGVDATLAEELFALVDLSRIQWVSPTFARVLFHSGYINTMDIAAADPDKLYNDVENSNQGNLYFRGKVGLRDITRVVQAASFWL